MRDISTKNNLLCNFFRLVLHTGAGASLGTDLSSGSQCDLGQRRACQLIHHADEQHKGIGEDGQAQPTQKEGAKQQTSQQIRGDGRQRLRAKGKNEKGKRSAARKNAYTSSILSTQIKNNRNTETRQRAPVGQIKETPSVIAARCHLPHGGRLWREGEVFHSAKGSLFEGAGTA